MADATLEFAARFSHATSRSTGALVFTPETREEAVRGVRLAHSLGLQLSRAPREGAVCLDPCRLDRVLELDERSRLVHVEVGATLGAVEARASTAESSLMTAAPASITVSAYLASGCAGARAIDDDPVGQTVAGLEAVSLDGRHLQIRPAPRRAVGPDLVGAILASDWSLAIPLSVHLVLRPVRALHALGYRFRSADDAEHALAWIRGRGARPAQTRLRVEPEGALLSLWLEAGPLLSPMQTIVTEEARRRGGVVTEPDARATDAEAPPPSPALARFEASLRGPVRAR